MYGLRKGLLEKMGEFVRKGAAWSFEVFPASLCLVQMGGKCGGGRRDLERSPLAVLVVPTRKTAPCTRQKLEGKGGRRAKFVNTPKKFSGGGKDVPGYDTKQVGGGEGETGRRQLDCLSSPQRQEEKLQAKV